MPEYGVTVIANSTALLTNVFMHRAVLEKGGLPKLSQNVMGLIWGKLLVNIGINALTAITGLKNGRHSETDELVLPPEAVAVAKERRHSRRRRPSGAREQLGLTATNRSSMLQDVSNKRKTEIDVINGAIVQEGKRLGIPTPVNKVLYNLVSVKEKTYEEV